jgi:hypothetical protein
MAGVEIPDMLKALLVGTEFDAPTSEFANAVGELLEDNVMPFFPAYTDHGEQHVTAVLETVVRLIPEPVLTNNILKAQDAAVISCAAMLHDLAMHMREPGFIALVDSATSFRPCAWFSDSRPGRIADVDWPRLWESFQLEARHFGPAQLHRIFGPNGEIPAVAYEESLDPQNWVDTDRLLIGEFLRRHHARVAHEIALYGFPGLEQDVFPILVNTLPKLGDVIGVVARSHGEDLRQMNNYLGYLAPGDKRPKGALLLYHMALLRIADYLQLDAGRAPLLLLRLKHPQSLQSIEEWEKERAVSSVSWEHQDPYAIYINVDAAHGLRTHLTLTELVSDIQLELDSCSAILDEVSGIGAQNSLSLAKRRLLTNLEEKSLEDQLRYVPRKAALRSDPDLFRLVVKDLYGNQPAVAGRELVQNAVDAIRARRALELTSGMHSPRESPQLNADVVVTLEEREAGRWVLRVSDQGVGMTPEVVINYFLQAGASFGPTHDELEGLDGGDAVDTMRAGRFGVGGFAAFLLGPECHVVTRHVEAERGLRFKASLSKDLIELEWDDKAPVGTTVEVPFDVDALPRVRWGRSGRQSPDQFLIDVAHFFRLRTPKVAYEFKGDNKVAGVKAPADVPSPKGRLPDRWRRIPTPSGYDAVLWHAPPSRYRRFSGKLREGLVVHNGLLIEELTEHLVLDEGVYSWSSQAVQNLIVRPAIAVFDSQHRLPIALHRYGLIDPALPFEDELLRSIGLDLVAHALAIGPRSHPLQRALDFPGVFSRDQWWPLLPSLMTHRSDDTLLVLWEAGYQARDLVGESVSIEDLVTLKGPVSWRDFPHRTALSLEDVDPTDYGYEEFREWGQSLDLVSQSASTWAERLNCDTLATVVVRGHVDLPLSEDLEVTSSIDLGWRELPVHGVGGIYVDGDNYRIASHERKLVNAACALRKAGNFTSLAVTAFGNFRPEDELEKILSGAWLEYLGKGVYRGPHKRKRMMAKILTDHPPLRPWV